MDTSHYSREALRHPERRSHTALQRPATTAAARRDSSLNSASGRTRPSGVPFADWMSFAALALRLHASGSSHRTLGAGRPLPRPVSDAFPTANKTKSPLIGSYARTKNHLTPKALMRAQGQPAIPTISAHRTPQRLRATIVLPLSYAADLGRAPLSPTPPDATIKSTSEPNKI